MAKTSRSTFDAAICAAAWQVIGRDGWEKLSLNAIAKTSKLPLARVKERVNNNSDLISLMTQMTDDAAIAAAGVLTGSAHDKFFDLLMARFDIMQRHRKAIENMATAAKHDRALGLALTKAAADSAYRFINAAQLNETFPPRLIVATGLIAIYGWAFCAWRKDTSRDMAKTMATVDRALRWSENLVNLSRKYFPQQN